MMNLNLYNGVVANVNCIIEEAFKDEDFEVVNKELGNKLEQLL